MSQPTSQATSEATPQAAPPSGPPNASRLRAWPIVLVAVLVVSSAAWMLSRAGGGAEPAKLIETAEGVALRRAQALVVNEPSDANARAWDRAARVYRAQRSKP